MKKPEIILAAHRGGEVNLHSMSLKEIAKKFGCGEATACLARQRARKEDKVKAPKFAWQIVIEAHKEGRVNLYEDSDKAVGKIMSVHHAVVERARRELGISKGGQRVEDPYSWYWHRWRKKYGVFNTWGVIPERVGLTKNEWLRRNEDRA